jgi:hypothetical protein
VSVSTSPPSGSNASHPGPAGAGRRPQASPTRPRWTSAPATIQSERLELALDLEDHQTHDEGTHEHVQQHAHLDQQRQAVRQRESEEVDPVLEHQVAQHLRERLAPAGEQQEADHQRGERDRDEQRQRALRERGQSTGHAEGDAGHHEPQ